MESFRTIMALEMIRSLLHAVAGENGGDFGEVDLQAATEPVPVFSEGWRSLKNRQPPLHVDGTAKSSFDGIIESAAAAHEVDPALVRAVIRVESNFEAQSTSPKGAMGLMQLMPGTARDLGVKNPYDPEENIHGGTRYLKILLERFDGDPAPALAVYNWGMGNMARHPERMPRETRAYVSRVMQEYAKTKGEG